MSDVDVDNMIFVMLANLMTQLPSGDLKTALIGTEFGSDFEQQTASPANRMAGFENRFSLVQIFMQRKCLCKFKKSLAVKLYLEMP